MSKFDPFMTSLANSAIQCSPHSWTQTTHKHWSTGCDSIRIIGATGSLLAHTGAIPKQIQTTDALDQ